MTTILHGFFDCLDHEILQCHSAQRGLSLRPFDEIFGKVSQIYCLSVHAPNVSYDTSVDKTKLDLVDFSLPGERYASSAAA